MNLCAPRIILVIVRLARRIILNDVQPPNFSWTDDEISCLYNYIGYFHAGEVRIKYAEDPMKDVPVRVDMRVVHQEKTIDLRKRLIKLNQAKPGQIDIEALKRRFDKLAHHTMGEFQNSDEVTED